MNSMFQTLSCSAMTYENALSAMAPTTSSVPPTSSRVQAMRTPRTVMISSPARRRSLPPNLPLPRPGAARGYNVEAHRLQGWAGRR